MRDTDFHIVPVSFFIATPNVGAMTVEARLA